MEGLGKIWKWLAPIGIFVLGFLGLLFFLIFTPTINSTASLAESEIPTSVVSAFWGLDWSFKSVMMLLFGFIVFVILIGVAVAWIKRK
jgi:hypothetical protein